MSSGYIHVNRNGRTTVEHRLVAEAVLGRPLPPLAVVHHVNDIRTDNRPCNLVICENDAYHKLLHYRRKVLRAGGNPDTDRVCSTCRRVLPTTEYSPTVQDGRRQLSWDCRECCRTRSAGVHARKRLANPPGPQNADKTHCPSGHPYDAENTAYNTNGSRSCRACRRRRAQEQRRAKNAAV